MKIRRPLWKKGKTYKRPYSKSKRFDKSCRNHGGCDYCRNNRLYFDRRRRGAADQEIKEFLKGEL